MPLRDAPPWVPPLLAVLGLGLAWVLADVLLLVFAALLLSLILRGLAGPLSSRLPLSDRVALVLVVAALAIALGAALLLFGSEVRTQLADLGERLPRAWDEVREHLSKSRLGTQALGWLDRSLSGNGGGDIAGTLGRLVSLIGSMATGLILVVAGGIYFAAQPGVYWRGAIGMLPPQWRSDAKDALTSVGGSLRRWLLAQLAAMVIVGVLAGTACALLGLPGALALGLFAALCEFVPVLGSVIAALPALLLALTQGWELTLWVALAYFGIQQLEGNVISPLLIHRTVSVPPAVTLFAILGFGVMFGVMGVLLAAPLAVAVHVLVTEFWARRLPPPVPTTPARSPEDQARSTRAA